MMRATLLFLICTLIGLGGLAAEPVDWNEVITPTGEPLVGIDIARALKPGPMDRLTLVHRLRFDGVRYLSQVWLSQLNSRLFPRGENSYEWRALDGGMFVLVDKLVRNPRPGSWRVVNNPERGEVAVIGGDREVYVYRKSYLVEYEKAGRSYRFNRSGMSCEVSDARGGVIIRQVEDESGVVTITAYGSTAVLKYDEGNHLVSCSSDFSGEVRFRYSDDLLVGVVQNGRGRNYEWGLVHALTFQNPERRLPPAVVKSEGYCFRYAGSLKFVSGIALRGGTKVGSWGYNLNQREYLPVDASKGKLRP